MNIMFFNIKMLLKFSLQAMQGMFGYFYKGKTDYVIILWKTHSWLN